MTHVNLRNSVRTTLARVRLRARPSWFLLLIPLFGVLLLGALWSAFVVRHHSEREATLALAMRETESFAAAFSEYTLRELRDLDRTSWLIKAQFEHDGTVNLPYLMRNQLLPRTGPIRVSVTDGTGNVIASNQESTSTVSMADRDFFQRHAANDTGVLDISQPFTGHRYGPSAIRMSRRLNLHDGAFGGVVILSVDPTYFADFYRESQLGSHGVVAMLGTDGVYRMRRSGNQIDAAFDGSTTPLFAHAAAKSEGAYVGDSSIDHTRRLIAYRKLADYPLIVAVARSEDEVMAQFNRFWATYLVASSGASLVIFIFFATTTVLAYRARRSAIEVRRQRGFLQALVDNMPLGVIARSMKAHDRGRIIVWNPAAEVIFGVPGASALGKSIDDVFAPDYAAGIAQRDRELLASPMVQDLPQVKAELRHVGPRLLRVVRAPIFDLNDKVGHVLSIIQDVTSEEARADALRLSAKVFETTADAIVISDAEDRVIAVNAAFSRLTGFEPGEMLGKPLDASPFRSSDPAEFSTRRQTLLEDGSVTAEVLRYRKDGSSLTCRLTRTCVRDVEGTIVNYVRVVTDISKLKDAQKEVERLANLDVLTGLLNRRMFHDRLEQALGRAERAGQSVGLLFIDLDHFKTINDAHGHDAGDAVLQEVTRRLQRCVRASDSVCRLGGDEFTIVMENAMLPTDAYLVAERIAWALDDPIDIGSRYVECQASLGIALYPEHGREAETLLKHADMAMYRAKHAGRERCVMATAEDPVTEAEEARG
jgi:diguanylate cyclase (GGDEF)-like protein/PAS domain S-box-containing protein